MEEKNIKAKVYLLAHTTPVNTIDGSKDPERVVAAAGKLCYSKSNVMNLYQGLDDEATEKFVNMLSSMGHESPIEHISFTFGIEGISRTCSHQIVRHRIASYSQQSQRYVDLQNSFNYIIPPAIENNEKAKSIYLDSMKDSETAYKEITQALIDEYTEGITDKKEVAKLIKKALEDSRFALPNACETKIIVTMNARTLLNFFKERCCSRAQWEIRDVADQMLDIVLDIAPNVFANAGAPCVFGKCPEGKMSCGEKQQPKIKQIIRRR
ncbi:MAG: FAD-dependent thymidylate synthase [Bacilli bacterium]|nr:FAD-dependent thymidylate synthase [Bacilli bacterium]